MRIQEWPNKMGMDVTSGPIRFEIWYPDTSHVDYKATKVDSTGFGLMYKRGFMADSHEEAAKRVIEDWKTKKATWIPCE